MKFSYWKRKFFWTLFKPACW